MDIFLKINCGAICQLDKFPAYSIHRLDSAYYVPTRQPMLWQEAIAAFSGSRSRCRSPYISNTCKDQDAGKDDPKGSLVKEMCKQSACVGTDKDTGD